jgi:hypothetical protein
VRFVLLGRRANALAMAGALFAGALLNSPSALAGETERFSYDVEWRLIRAGTVVIEAGPSDGRVKLDSAGLVSALYKVNDTYTVSYDPGRCATGSHLDAQEGKRHRETQINFDRNDNKAVFVLRDVKANSVLRSDQIDVPNCVHDVLGALFMLREARLDPGRSTSLPVSDGRRAAQVQIDAQEREDVTTPAGSFHAIRYEAGLFNGVVYQRSGRVQLWLTDDGRKLPVQIRLRLGFPIGNVTLQMTKQATEEEQP